MAHLARIAICLIATSFAAALGPHLPKVRPPNLPTYTPSEAGILNGSDFAAWVAHKAARGQNAVALAPGRYHMNYADANNAYITWQQVRDTTVWMDRVNISLADNTVTAFNVDSCSNLTTYGPTIWWQVPGFGQATITKVTPQADNSYDVQFHLDDGYDSSTLVSDGLLDGEYTNPTNGRLQPGPGWSTFSGNATAIEGRPNTYTYTYSDGYFTPLVGYKILSRGQFLFCNQVSRSNRTTFNDLTMLNCGGFGFFLTLNRHTTLNSFSLRRADFPPPGGTELPARSSSADGIHSSNDFIGPTIDSAYFSALDDDCIAIHGSLGSTNTSSDASFVGTVNAQPGDILRFYTPDTYTPIGTAVVIRSSSTDPNAPASLTVNKLPKGFDAGSTKYVNQNRVGSGFAVRNTHTTGNRGRGAIIKASDGIIENNVFEGVSYAGLYLGPEFSSWGEADYVHDLVIRNNSIINCSYLNKAGSAFDLHGDSDAEGSDDPADNPRARNYNITISQLTIKGTGSHSNLYIGAAHAVRLNGVVIEDMLSQNYTLWETTPDAVVNFQNAAFSNQVGVCLKDYDGQSGVKRMKIYGNVTGSPHGLGNCK